MTKAPQVEFDTHSRCCKLLCNQDILHPVLETYHMCRYLVTYKIGIKILMIGVIQQLRGQNFAIFDSHPLVDSFYILSLAKKQTFFDPLSPISFLV